MDRWAGPLGEILLETGKISAARKNISETVQQAIFKNFPATKLSWQAEQNLLNLNTEQYQLAQQAV